MKTKLGGVNALYPSLTVIVGTVVEGRPNFITVAHVGIMNHGTPQYISMGLGKAHYSNRGIKENGVFSVNLPPESLVAETDYLGMVSGKNVDKSGVFELFYGEMPAAPMIKACPVNMECRLERIVDFPTHEVFVGEIVETHADEAVLKAGKIDVTKVRPLLFDMASVKYYGLGPEIAPCWNIGKSMKKK